MEQKLFLVLRQWGNCYSEQAQGCRRIHCIVWGQSKASGAPNLCVCVCLDECLCYKAELTWKKLYQQLHDTGRYFWGWNKWSTYLYRHLISSMFPVVSLSRGRRKKRGQPFNLGTKATNQTALDWSFILKCLGKSVNTRNIYLLLLKCLFNLFLLVIYFISVRDVTSWQWMYTHSEITYFLCSWFLT